MAARQARAVMRARALQSFLAMLLCGVDVASNGLLVAAKDLRCRPCPHCAPPAVMIPPLWLNQLSTALLLCAATCLLPDELVPHRPAMIRLGPCIA